MHGVIAARKPSPQQRPGQGVCCRNGETQPGRQKAGERPTQSHGEEEIGGLREGIRHQPFSAECVDESPGEEQRRQPPRKSCGRPPSQRDA
jgi:hypothetical protein